MLSKGNGTPQQCVANLINLFQFEVPYARLKGLDPNIIDLPKDEAEQAIKNNVTWLVENYEPRVTLNGVNVTYTQDGKLIPEPNISVNEVISG